MKFLSFFRSKKEINATPENTISSLAPKVLTKKEDIEKIQPYLNKLEETLDAKEVNNIALTGSYGSGKSTIIKTFKDLHPDYEYLNISLAAFNQKDGELYPWEKEELERLLEVSILQQIFYHVEPDKIPESRFKRIINIPKWKIRLISCGFVVWVSSTILLLKYDYLDKMDPSTWSFDKSFDWFAPLFFLIAFLGVGIFSKFIIQLFSNSKINKVNIKGELELGDKVNKSVFNEHLEEILYFFERTKYNVVVIEDLDRFDNTDIFTKLREINILLNNSKPVGREINFIYAIGDDLFKDKKERVKFFEYIIPVIPFINSSNALEQLQTLIKESGLKEDIFSREFMFDVITFIDDIDMRLLINIFHEFVIYRHALKSEFIKKPEELFAIITYKNIEPDDFSNLNSRHGKLYTLINNKTLYIEEFISSIDDDIKEKEDKIEEIKRHATSDIQELRAIYVNRILCRLPSDVVLTTSIKDLTNDNEFENLRAGNLEYEKYTLNRHYAQMYNKSNNDLKFNFSDIEKEIDINYSYDKRAELTNDKCENKIEILQNEIITLKTKKTVIDSWDLKQIFEEVDLNQYLEDFSNNALLRNLILNGYINENYNDYISLFHEGSITKEDLTFERNVKGGYPAKFTYQLHKISGLLERIDQRYFSRESILNFDLVNYLGNNYKEHASRYDAIINLLSNERERSIAFIDEYVKDETRPIGIFIEKLTQQWNNFFYYVVEDSNYYRDKIDNYLRLILTYGNLDDILNQNHDILIEIISTNHKFLSLINTKQRKDLIKKISDILSELDIKFNVLEHPTEQTKALFDYVYRNNHYKINKENILQMLEVNGGGIDMDAFHNKNYGTIKNSGCSYLIQYIDKNIESYIENIYLKIDTNIHEEETDLVDLLNNDDIRISNKKTIIEKTETVISDISKIDDKGIRVLILTNNKVEATWKNIYKIRQDHDEVSEDIIDFINVNENAKRLSLLPVTQEKDENGKMPCIQMWKDILASPSLSIESFKLILSSGNISIKFFDFEETAKDRLEIMISRKQFVFENQIFDKLEEFHSLGLPYLENYKENILAFKDGFMFEEQHLTEIFTSEDYSVSDINSILDTYDISDWQSDQLLSNLQDRLADDKGLTVDTTKIIEAASFHTSDSHNVKILNNYFDKFSKSEIRSIIGLLKDVEYHKYLSTHTTESLKLTHQPYENVLFDLMKENNYIGQKSKRITKGYQIFKNKNTELL